MFLISHYDGHSDANSHLTTIYDCAGTCTKDMIRSITKIMDLWFTVYVLSYEDILDGNEASWALENPWPPIEEACLHVYRKDSY
jgi:hypothetical protein